MIEDICRKSLSVGYHEGMLKELAHGIKNGSFCSIEKAAEMMSILINEEYPSRQILLVPIPQHTGVAEYTLELCNRIAGRIKADVMDVLRCQPRRSFYKAKKEGLDIADEIRFFASGSFDTGRLVLLVDNVVATGTTANAARKALGADYRLVSLTNSNINK